MLAPKAGGCASGVPPYLSGRGCRIRTAYSPRHGAWSSAAEPDRARSRAAASRNGPGRGRRRPRLHGVDRGQSRHRQDPTRPRSWEERARGGGCDRPGRTLHRPGRQRPTLSPLGRGAAAAAWVTRSRRRSAARYASSPASFPSCWSRGHARPAGHRRPGLAAPALRRDARGARAFRRRGSGRPRARGPALGRRIDAGSRVLPRACGSRTAPADRGDLSQRRGRARELPAPPRRGALCVRGRPATFWCWSRSAGTRSRDSLPPSPSRR